LANQNSIAKVHSSDWTASVTLQMEVASSFIWQNKHILYSVRTQKTIIWAMLTV